MGLHGSRPHTRTLDVYSDEVHLGEHLRQPDGIFTLATSQFQDYWVLIMEDFGVPRAREGVTNKFLSSLRERVGRIADSLIAKKPRIGELEDVWQRLHVSKFC